MGFLDKLFGTDPDEEYRRTTEEVRRASSQRSDDEIAVERYRYLLRTAPPEAIERVHEEAFGNLTAEQRALVYQQLKAEAPAGEAPSSDSPQALAVSATRSEMRQPGTLERAFGGATAGPGFGSMFASSMLGSIAGYFVASTLMSTFMPTDMGIDSAGGSVEEAGSLDSGESISADGGSDFGMGDAGFGDFGDFGF